MDLKVKIVKFLAGLMFCLGCSGCIPVLIGAGGIVTGYTLSNDAATGSVNMDYHTLWELCIDKLDSMESAQLSLTDESKGLIKARVSEYALTININSSTQQVQQLKVTARKFYLPKPQFAQKIFLKILNEVE